MARLHVHKADGRAYCGKPADTDKDTLTTYFNAEGVRCLSCYNRLHASGYNMDVLKARLTEPKEGEKLQ